MTPEEFKAALAQATAEVSTWPEWKRRWLEQDDWTSGTCPPREPVDNSQTTRPEDDDGY